MDGLRFIVFVHSLNATYKEIEFFKRRLRRREGGHRTDVEICAKECSGTGRGGAADGKMRRPIQAIILRES